MLACEWLITECRDSWGYEANDVFSNRLSLSLSSSWPYFMTHYSLYGIMFQCPLLLTWFNFNPSMDK